MLRQAAALEEDVDMDTLSQALIRDLDLRSQRLNGGRALEGGRNDSASEAALQPQIHRGVHSGRSAVCLLRRHIRQELGLDSIGLSAHDQNAGKHNQIWTFSSTVRPKINRPMWVGLQLSYAFFQCVTPGIWMLMQSPVAVQRQHGQVLLLRYEATSARLHVTSVDVDAESKSVRLTALEVSVALSNSAELVAAQEVEVASLGTYVDRIFCQWTRLSNHIAVSLGARRS